MALQVAGKNLAVGGVVDAITHISLHEDDPGSNGANEVAGGSYARQAPTYTAVSTGEADLDDPLVFDIPAGSAVAYWGAWAGSTFLGGEALDLQAPQEYQADGTFTLNSAPVAHA